MARHVQRTALSHHASHLPCIQHGVYHCRDRGGRSAVLAYLHHGVVCERSYDCRPASQSAIVLSQNAEVKRILKHPDNVWFMQRLKGYYSTTKAPHDIVWFTDSITCPRLLRACRCRTKQNKTKQNKTKSKSKQNQKWGEHVFILDPRRVLVGTPRTKPQTHVFWLRPPAPKVLGGKTRLNSSFCAILKKWRQVLYIYIMMCCVLARTVKAVAFDVTSSGGSTNARSHFVYLPGYSYDDDMSMPRLVSSASIIASIAPSALICFWERSTSTPPCVTYFLLTAMTVCSVSISTTAASAWDRSDREWLY